MHSQYAALRMVMVIPTFLSSAVKTLARSQEVSRSNHASGLNVSSVSESTINRDICPISSCLHRIAEAILWFNILPVNCSKFYLFRVQYFIMSWFNILPVHSSNNINLGFNHSTKCLNKVSLPYGATFFTQCFSEMLNQIFSIVKG